VICAGSAPHLERDPHTRGVPAAAMMPVEPFLSMPPICNLGFSGTANAQRQVGRKQQ
jgi:hypothetical protein